MKVAEAQVLGRLLLYEPMETVSDGAAEASSRGLTGQYPNVAVQASIAEKLHAMVPRETGCERRCIRRSL